MSYIGNQSENKVSPAYMRETLSPDGSATYFDLIHDVPGYQAENLLVTVNNVIQEPANAYTIINDANNRPRRLNFGVALATTDSLYVIHRGAGELYHTPPSNSVGTSALQDNLRSGNVDSFTATAGQTAFTLSEIPYSAQAINVYVNGIYQKPITNYTVTGSSTALTLSSGILLNDEVDVHHNTLRTTVSHVADAGVTTTKLADTAVTIAKLATDTGVAADYHKIPSVTTTERNALTAAVGMLLYNTTLGILQQYASSGWASIDSPPTIASLNYPGDDTALDIVGEFNLTCTTQSSTTVLASSTTGIVVGQVVKGTGIPTSPVPTVESIITNTSFVLSGAATASASVTLTFNTQTLIITGTNFQTGATVTIDGTAPSTVTRDSSSQITVTGTPAKTAGTKVDGLVVSNTSGLSASINVDYSALPGWSSPASGNLGTLYIAGSAISTIDLVGGSPATTSYALSSGSLPPGLAMSTSTGDITGTITGTTYTTYNITVDAIDAETQSSPRLFNIITAAPLPTGGTLSTYTGYRVHRYLTGSTFVVSSSITADILVVGGGAAGGARWGGGGGSGGVVYAAGTTLIAGTYTIVRGAGGTGTNGTDIQGAGGGNSTFTQTSGGSSVVLTAHGGSGGTAYDAADNQTVRGSSGGTHAHSTAPTGSASTQTGLSQTYSGGSASNYGNRGGQGAQSGGSGGGGGGAGAVGQDGAHHNTTAAQTNGGSATGGNGVQIAWITPDALGLTSGSGSHNNVAYNETFFFAAGGGGSGFGATATARYAGTGGLGGGGGGAIANDTNSVAGLGGGKGFSDGEDGQNLQTSPQEGGDGGANTGSGGGGAAELVASGGGDAGNGGSGIVIIRYAV